MGRSSAPNIVILPRQILFTLDKLSAKEPPTRAHLLKPPDVKQTALTGLHCGAAEHISVVPSGQSPGTSLHVPPRVTPSSPSSFAALDTWLCDVCQLSGQEYQWREAGGLRKPACVPDRCSSCQVPRHTTYMTCNACQVCPQGYHWRDAQLSTSLALGFPSGASDLPSCRIADMQFAICNSFGLKVPV
jgi:hypothetical protein